MSLRVENLSKSYQQGDRHIQILNQLNLQIQTGGTAAILGQSGSGKSTLLALLAGLDRPQTGSIWIQDQDITVLNEIQLTDFRGKKIGIIFQQYHLLPHLTALENVMLPLEIQNQDQILIRAEQALEQVGLSHRLKHFPSQMSGGECQRVAFARALVIKPEILLADEPSGNLDIETGQTVMDLFFDTVEKNKITTCLVTHSLELSQRCQKQYKLIKGSLVENSVEKSL